MKHSRLWSIVFALFLGLALAGCSDDTASGSDTGTDSGSDAGADAADDSGADATPDAEPDTTADADISDGGSDAGDDAAADGGGGDVLDEPDSPAPIGDPVTVAVGDIFGPGTGVRDAYGGDRAVVDGDGNLTIIMHPNGVLLLERDEARGPEADFSWVAPTVYFVITDRFENGDPSNDASYGRTPAEGERIGTFRGGDFAGIVDRLDYIDSLGVNAIWITSPVEQIKGWVGGGFGDFQYFPYHGYWAQDFTRLDANFGDEDDLRELVREAHNRGIRVVFDVVMNHPGYASMEDINTYVPNALAEGWEDWTPGPGQNWHSYNDLFIDFDNEDWVDWWGVPWIRATFPDHQPPGGSDLNESLAGLPDFRTESDETAGLPPFLLEKADTAAIEITDGTVRDYLVEWHTEWVRDFGIDGFRCDTAKHVEQASWAALNAAAVDALSDWKEDNPDDAIDDLDFWMTGEVFGLSVDPSGGTSLPYFTQGGFDSLIHFSFQNQIPSAAQNHEALEALFSSYASAVNAYPHRGRLSFISSHDTYLYYPEHGRDDALQRATGTALLLLPGGVQIFYGDESGRRNHPASLSTERPRSVMNWDSLDEDMIAHWQRVGRFRNRHLAVGAGTHAEMEYADGYMFSRQYTGDSWTDDVVVVLAD